MRFLSLSAIVILAGLVATAAEPLPKRQFAERHMGVDVTLTLYGGTESAANDAAARAFARVARLNGIFSDYEPESEAMRLCRMTPPGQAVPVSEDLMKVLLASRTLSERSGGAFDVTVGPVIKLWRRARRQKQLPDAEQLQQALQRVNDRYLTLDKAHGTVTLARSDLQLDFGGIVKGYAAQQALNTLRDAGFPQALVSVAGDLAAGDAPPDAPGWKIGVAPLDHADGPPTRWVNLARAAISTSGDAFQFVEIDGVRYSHIVDTKTGLGLTRRSSVTVIAPDGMLADGLATAATVLGPEAGLKLIAETPQAAGLIVFAEGDGVRVSETQTWTRWAWTDSPTK